MDNLCIVVVPYDRADCLKRLLASLLRADYLSYKVDLIVSIDHGPSQPDIESLLENFYWPFGEFKTRTFKKNLGLRTHILKCGSITDEYDAVVILEDDLAVGQDFFKFASSALQAYSSEPKIAGVSLYAPAFNEMAELTFQPTPSEYDTYFLSSAQSWGQCWTKDMWQGFWAWYQHNNSPLEVGEDMPARIYSWPESSWKKYFMKYVAVSGKTWVYPYISHSTNFSEIGTHNQTPTAQYQTVLSENCSQFSFPDLGKGVAYDIFFERKNVQITLSTGELVTVDLDLYGSKIRAPTNSYLATTRKLDRPALTSYGLSSKPHEVNVINLNAGDDIQLYQISAADDVYLPAFPKTTQYAYYSSLGWYGSLVVGLQGLKVAIMRRLTIKAIKKWLISQR